MSTPGTGTRTDTLDRGPAVGGRRALVARAIATAASVTLAIVGSTMGAFAGDGCVTPPNGMVAWWPGDGDADDLHGQNDGVLRNGTIFREGKVDRAFRVDGVDDMVRIQDDSDWTIGDRPFTVMAWVRFRSLPTRAAPIVSHDEGPADVPKWIFWFDNEGHHDTPGNALRFHLNGPATGPLDTVTAFWTPQLARWYHVAVTRGGPVYRLFIDGVRVARQWDRNTIPNVDAGIEIGSAESGASLDGRIDEVQIFSRALSRDRIHRIVGAGEAGQCKPE